MFELTIAQIAAAVSGQILCGSPALQVTGVGIDSRELTAGQLFVALTGERSDGHMFVPEALAGAAGAALVTRSEQWSCPPDKAIIKVADTGQALLDLAAWYRCQIPVRTVAITGSTGKTTTKDLAFQILSSGFNTLRSIGNFNTEIGLPLTLFNLRTDHQVAVVELGMRGRGQIAQLAQLAQPEVGIITNVGLAHMELLGNQQNIAAAKAELLDWLPAGGLAILNADDPWFDFLRRRSPCPVFTFGVEQQADIRASDVENLGSQGIQFTVTGPGYRQPITLPLLGRFNVFNCLAAMAAGHHFGLSAEQMAAALKTARPSAMRFNLLSGKQGSTVIDDAYNSNPTSLRGALDTLVDLAAGRKTMVVAGDMLELGHLMEEAHRHAGEYMAGLSVDCLITAGPAAALMAEAAISAGMDKKRVFPCATTGEAAAQARARQEADSFILVKASRGLSFERVVTALVGDRLPECP